MKLTEVIESRGQGPTRFGMHSVEGFGKALESKTPVLTPRGWVPIGTLSVGDKVIGSNGKATTVVGVFPQGTKALYRVEMTDGTSTTCCIEHLWQTHHIDQDAPRVRSLGEIVETLHRKVSGPHAPSDGTYPNHRIPIVRAVEFDSNAELPIAPYLLGVLLGDGSLPRRGSVRVDKPERDVLERAAALLPDGDSATYSDARFSVRRTMFDGRPASIRTLLDDLGLIGTTSLDKFIPGIYMVSSVEDRLEILRGIFDTDGSVSTNGSRIDFSTSSPQLADDVAFVVRSLGGIVVMSTRIPSYTHKGIKRDGSRSYRLSVSFPQGDIVPVASEKHLKKWSGAKFQNYRAIDAVEPIGTGDAVCIKVDAPDGLFVVEDFIVTHNTTTAAYFPRPLFIGNERGIPRDLGFSVPTIAPATWKDVHDIVENLTYEKHDYQTAVFDTVDWLEPLLHRYVCERDTNRKTEMNPKSHVLESIEDYGFGKGYLVAEEEFRRLIGFLDMLQAKRGMHVVLLMHSHVKEFKNPSGPNFDRYEPKCHARIARVIVEWVETLVFGFFRIDASKITEDKERHKLSPDRARAKGITTGERIIGTQQSAMYDAKNRVGLVGEIALGDPNELVSWVMGEHLGNDVKPPAGWNRQDTRSETHTRNAPKRETTRAPEPEGKPAHHPDRAPDEQRRRDETLSRAREARIEDERRRDAEPKRTEEDARREAREWTEPKRLPNPPADLALSPIDEAIVLAGSISEKYRRTVEGWVTKANGDPDKHDAIIARVRDEAAKAFAQPQQ